MDELENKFLHSINLDALKKETGMTIEEIAKLAGIGPKVVYKWQYMHKDGSRPDFNAIVKLLQAGASTETLFGVDYAATHQLTPANPSEPDNTPIDYQDPKFLAALEKGMALIEARKKQGIK